MMREIKFRVWDNDNKVMFPPNEMPSMNGEFYLSTGGTLYERHDDTGGDFEVEGVALMQFTGLKDKNGKEIYEGDIVEIAYSHRNEEDGEYVAGESIKGFVAWDEHSTGWVVRVKSKMSVEPDGTVMTSIISKSPGWIEVIGENPELLK